MGTWQLQEAKARFSEVIRKAVAEGPQEITVHGQQAAVVLSREDYTRLTHKQISFVEFMRTSPLAGVELELDRDRSMIREVEL
ncbi:MAG: type II toxin-antitoxin system Phd/YefM family antitoxin [Magnetococcales bacterium]|nr:type II toxin-antitoxin system Phd/YefM family antitoxin [Magnetococcales bacterium]